MDLWIRSQDRKRLVPSPNLYVVYSEESQCAYIGDTLVGHIAKYATEERALEVLDDIQNKVCGNVGMLLATNSGIKPTNINGFSYCGVYEMPKE